MNRNSADKTIAEKLNGLDPLQVGLVSGREDAWERLQGRMDATPNRRLPVWYWPAAAALVGIVATSLWVFNVDAPVPAVVSSASSQVAPPHVAPAPAAHQPETLMITSPVIEHPANAPALIHNAYKEDSFTTIVANEPDVPEIHVAREVLPESVPPPRPMRVVHINELDAVPEESNEKGSFGLSIVHMPVVHINELQTDGADGRYWNKVNSRSGSSISFLGRRPHGADETVGRQGIFSIKLRNHN